MKTKEQILEWLDKQPWKGEFYEALFFEPVKSITYDDSFISGAFEWKKTKSGKSVWMKRDMEFLMWYYVNDKPMSWDEYCDKNPITDGACYIDSSSIITPICHSRPKNVDDDVNVMTEELCEAFLAYMKLIQLRNAWVKDYENGGNNMEYLKIVYTEKRGFYTVYLGKTGLSFPTSSMAEEFIKTFKDLLEVAKPLL